MVNDRLSEIGEWSEKRKSESPHNEVPYCSGCWAKDLEISKLKKDIEDIQVLYGASRAQVAGMDAENEELRSELRLEKEKRQ